MPSYKYCGLQNCQEPEQTRTYRSIYRSLMCDIALVYSQWLSFIHQSRGQTAEVLTGDYSISSYYPYATVGMGG